MNGSIRRHAIRASTATTSAAGADPRAGLHARLGLRIARSHVGSPAHGSYARTRRASLTDQGEGGGAYGYALAMTPLGKPTNFTNPDSAGLLDPRPDDDPLNINPVLEAQSVTRQQTVNRVFGSAYAELQDRDGLTYRMNFGPDYTQLNDGCFNGPWTHGNCANLGANSTNQGQPPQAGRVQSGRLHVHARQHAPAQQDARRNPFVRHHRPLQHSARSLHEGFAVRDEPAVPDAALVRPRLGHGRQRSEPDLASGRSSRTWVASTTRLLDRYSLSVTGRSDGSSRLAPGHKWATFPSVGLAWQVGDEPFMRGLQVPQLAQASRQLRHDGQHVDHPVPDARHAPSAHLHVRHDARSRLQAGRRFRIRISPGRRPIRRTSASITRCSTTASPARSTGTT